MRDIGRYLKRGRVYLALREVMFLISFQKSFRLGLPPSLFTFLVRGYPDMASRDLLLHQRRSAQQTRSTLPAFPLANHTTKWHIAICFRQATAGVTTIHPATADKSEGVTFPSFSRDVCFSTTSCTSPHTTQSQISGPSTQAPNGPRWGVVRAGVASSLR